MIYILNFKTYFKKEKNYLKLINSLKKIKTNNEIWLALNPYFFFSLIKKIKGFKIGIQNLGFDFEKPQTGEIIYDFELINKANFVLIGHSERYRVGENLEILKRKIDTLQERKINLVIFFSENSYEPKEKFEEIKKIVEKNLNYLLSGLKEKNYKKIYLVYEPWWAISTEGGKIPSKKFLNEFLNWYFSKYNFPILYGGSYNFSLKNEYKDLKFDGYVLGKASTEIKELKRIIKS